ncbi:alanine/glycine:cation symporter family protein [Flaviflexus equikiangi]|uniref:Alanine:cation symporter family protein n=1 Tax=Flaviflexus equikiangi TaxID=2758573 RepID=A0ABS2TFG8_9ACTO|nr:alanine/glycine:cation symporter family protein [Flaviflexus equikiangi]MBM9433400.1 alanine:cation symporter family protein [Flaviflexus equikiangi]
MERFEQWLADVTGPATTWLSSINDWVYTWIIIAALVGTGIYLTVATRGVQFRHARTMFSHLRESRKNANGGISSFQAFAMGMATRIGIGNITGVALAMILGGPGALFWMWAVAFFGMATAFAEATLAQIFKQRHGDGSFRGGPATYILYGTGSKALANLFAVFMVFSMIVAMPMVQANSISGVLYGSHNLPLWISGLIIASLTAAVLVGGVRGIARATEYISPIMALAYLFTAVVIIALNMGELPSFFSDVFASAFGLNEALAGTAGGILAAILNGVRRGLFSNEAGMGTNPNAAATATVNHPVSQGLIQSLGVFFDTMLVSTATGFIILTSGVVNLQEVGQEASSHITSDAVSQTLGGWMAVPFSIMIFFFAFSSILGAYAYADANLVFMGLTSRGWQIGSRVVAVACSGIGAVLALPFVWTLMDSAMAVVTLLNLIGVIALSKWVTAALRDYEKQQGESEISFEPANAGLPGRIATDGWVPAP